MTSSDQLDAVFAALAHPTRRAILERVSREEATVNQLAEPFDMSLPAISRHIRVLEEAGLIVRARDAQFRPCSVNPDGFEVIANWAEQYRPIWEARFDRLDTLLAKKKDISK